MYVYEVISYNLDVKDGYFVNILYADKDQAKAFCRKHLENKEHRDIIEDLDGLLGSVYDKSLQWEMCKEKPAIYYRSHYGNYRCVVYVQTRHVN